MFDTNHLLVFFTAATVILVAYPKFMQVSGFYFFSTIFPYVFLAIFLQPGGLLFNDSGPQIDAPCGKIKGTFSYTRWSQKSIAQFTGIPYAQPPVGQMRFLRPKPFEDQQNRVIDATQRPVRCVQPELMIPGLSYTGQEDCLVLNIYVPEKMDTDLDEDLPVMVFIHGGGLVTGESGMYGPKYLLERNVILVTINYRLGPLGFLNLGTEDDLEDSSIPAGNQGLWDQLLALKWVRRNIGSFGGDPERVTIFGESAGGWSVSYHLISEQSKGLFHRAIVQSGSLLTSYLYTSASEDFLEQHKTFASHLGCQMTSDRLAISHCLRNKSPAEIMDKLFSLDGFANFHSVHGIPNPNIWKGTLVKGRQKSFFQAEPKDTVLEGRLSHPQSVPVMMGFTQDEGLLDTAPLLNDPEKFNLLKNNWDESSISFLPWLSPGNQANLQDMGRAIKEFYFNNEVLDGSKHFGNLTDMFSDVEFIYGTDFTARFILKLTKKVIMSSIFSLFGFILSQKVL